MKAPLTAWSYEDTARWGSGPHVARHHLQGHPAFSREGLAQLLDRVPREIVHPYTMGADPRRREEWRRGQPTELPGATLLEVVERGRLWLNIVGVGAHDAAIGTLTRELYDEISELVPGFQAHSVRATLIISSPTAQVFYHADNQPNALWHIQGRKRIWVYPQGRRFITDEQLEEIVAGTRDEQLTYRDDLDAHAIELEMSPGDVAWWPQNSPHRVVNTSGLNVSLSTEHRTPQSTRREQIVTSNHVIRRHLPRWHPSTKDRGISTTGKIALGRAARLFLNGRRRYEPVATFIVDSSTEDGVRLL